MEQPGKLARDAVLPDFLGDRRLPRPPTILPPCPPTASVSSRMIIKRRVGVVLKDLRAQLGGLLAEFLAASRLMSILGKEGLHHRDVEHRLRM